MKHHGAKASVGMFTELIKLCMCVHVITDELHMGHSMSNHTIFGNDIEKLDETWYVCTMW